jgi:hypothetical protein
MLRLPVTRQTRGVIGNSRVARQPLALRLAAFGLAGAVAACAPTTPILWSRSPLTIKFVWAPRETPLTPLATPQGVPKAVVLRWNARDYSQPEIRALATQQCLAYHRQARAAGMPSGPTTDRMQRFVCVLALTTSGGPPRA